MPKDCYVTQYYKNGFFHVVDRNTGLTIQEHNTFIGALWNWMLLKILG